MDECLLKLLSEIKHYETDVRVMNYICTAMGCCFICQDGNISAIEWDVS